MKKIIMLIDSESYDSEKAVVSHVIVQCIGEKARVIKDRCKGFVFEIEKLAALMPTLEAIYPGYEIKDMRNIS